MSDVKEAKAVLKFVRVSPQKARLVANLVRGKDVVEAKRILTFTAKKSAKIILKVLDSAVANAGVAEVGYPDSLKVGKIYVDGGPVYKRRLPRARGRADMLRKPTSHFTVVVVPSSVASTDKEVQESAKK